jgi:catechol 2,3-dioxygenase-like lactoylglutathione lyase family enzyme
METTATSERTARFYEILGLPRVGVTDEGEPGPGHVAIRVSRADLPLLRWRLLTIGAPMHDESPAAVSFTDPDGVHVELIAEPRPA